MDYMYLLLQDNIKLLESLSLGSHTTQIDANPLLETVNQEKFQDYLSESSCLDADKSVRTENGQVDKVLFENALLKRAVVKMKEKLETLEYIERENFELKESLKQMNIANYTLRLHLQNALEGRICIDNHKDVF